MPIVGDGAGFRSQSGYAGEHSVQFYHPDMPQGTDKTLIVSTGLDGVKWSYELNVQSFPTYAGEVVQILGAYINDMTISGTVHTYYEMEQIYKYFATYLSIASQGTGVVEGEGAYNQTAMTMIYAHRGWQFKIQPITLPGFKYSRDVVAPTWQLTAHIVDGTGDVRSVEDMVKTSILNQSENGGFDLTGEIGYTADNPFSAPYPGNFDPNKTGASFSDFADYYNKLIPAYMQGDFSSITQGLGSKPAFGQTAPDDSDFGNTWAKEVKAVHQQIQATHKP